MNWILETLDETFPWTNEEKIWESTSNIQRQCHPFILLNLFFLFVLHLLKPSRFFLIESFSSTLLSIIICWRIEFSWKQQSLNPVSFHRMHGNSYVFAGALISNWSMLEAFHSKIMNYFIPNYADTFIAIYKWCMHI